MPHWCQFNGEQVHENAPSLAAPRFARGTRSVKRARTKPNQFNAKRPVNIAVFGIFGAARAEFHHRRPKIPHPDFLSGGGKRGMRVTDESGAEEPLRRAD